MAVFADKVELEDHEIIPSISKATIPELLGQKVLAKAAAVVAVASPGKRKRRWDV